MRNYSPLRSLEVGLTTWRPSAVVHEHRAEQGKATLRKVEVQLDEADELVCLTPLPP
jgi:hypothetical protein